MMIKLFLFFFSVLRIGKSQLSVGLLVDRGIAAGAGGDALCPYEAHHLLWKHSKFSALSYFKSQLCCSVTSLCVGLHLLLICPLLIVCEEEILVRCSNSPLVCSEQACPGKARLLRWH